MRNRKYTMLDFLSANAEGLVTTILVVMSGQTFAYFATLFEIVEVLQV